MAGGQERKKPTPIATQIVVADFGRSGDVANGGIELLYSLISGKSISGSASEFDLSGNYGSVGDGVAEGKSQFKTVAGDSFGGKRGTSLGGVRMCLISDP